ncbi:type II secretion system F family protein [Limisalsivibrio acetivorans]|uniref:type II secretion system F family protein n=1 Tax=Limisalsivibrio acetivorans TaxID=1304888 RepID=UPI0003B2E23A|nr:type II secretion system F family protein [Limisalsivibrio acetivorans]
MGTFEIKAVDKGGKKITKTIEVENEEELVPYLEHAGLNVISIHRAPFYAKYTRSRGRIKTQEVIEVLENLHLVIRSGLPTVTGLQDLAKDAENPAMKEILTDLSFRVQMGMNFSKAMEKYKKTFGEVVINLIKIGEETGKLDETLHDAVEHLKKLEDLKAKAKQALIYPSFAFVALSGALIFWLVFVMPKMMDAFSAFDIELPFITRAIMALSVFTQKYIVLITVLLIGAVILINVLRKTSKDFKLITDQITLRLPVFGVIITNFNFAFFAEYVRLMIAAGLPLYQALSLMEGSQKNLVYKSASERIREDMSIGSSFSDALSKQDLYPSLIIRMVNIGEQTGHLEEQLDNVAKYYYQKVDHIAANISKLIEPLIIGFVGGFMLIIFIGLLGPIFNLITGLS